MKNEPFATCISSSIELTMIKENVLELQIQEEELLNSQAFSLEFRDFLEPLEMEIIRPGEAEVLKLEVVEEEV